MKLKCFAIYDAAAQVYMAPFFQSTVGLAIRQFEQVANDPSTSVSKYPQDFTLFEIGSYDDSNGRMDPHDAPLPLGTALEYQRKEAQEQPWQEVAALAEVRPNGNHDSPGS